MAVFTPLSDDQVADFLERFDAGRLVRLEGVSGGTENSTFFVTTDRHALVLTLFEQGDQRELPFFVELLDHLAAHQLPVPGPLHDRQGIALQRLADRPALLFPRLPGEHPEQPTQAQCHAIGQTLGQMHALTRDFPVNRANPRDLSWIEQAAKRVMPYLDADEQQLMHEQIADFGRLLTPHVLPRGALHGDLFRDNTLFDGERLGGVIDFYNGCTGDLLFDLAIVINDWCATAQTALHEARYHAILDAYAAQRPFTAIEREVWPVMLRMTALRYWLSRLLVVHVDPPAHTLTPRDPGEYLRLLRQRIEVPVPPLPTAAR
ncbi:homoserine kinase [Kushneria sinocarnis]|uniref:Homoserine kinase n=1 Tax=Kushneria sinocarnis TaxID=595502 RepID=A0A420WU65_9GAMM|nr:homoserine kinase [Kushneria sinocarnis]RKQ96981.1 homoserine kinase [Kushneria sinocarnis]